MGSESDNRDLSAIVWQHVLSVSHEEIYLFSADTLRFIQVSRGALENLGYTAEEIRSLSAFDLKPDIGELRFRELIRPLLEGKAQRLHFETRHRRKDGTFYPVEVRLQYIAEGEPPLFIALILDLTERRKVEAALAESEGRFRALVEQSPLSIQIFDPHGNTRLVNAAFERLTGATLEHLSNYNILEDRQLEALGVMPYIRRGFAGEAARIPVVTYHTIETPEVETAPRKFTVRAFIYPIKNEKGEVVEVILMHEDVTEKEHAEAALLETKARLLEAQSIARLGSWELDLERNHLEWSDEIFRIFEIDPEQFGASYEAFLEAVHPDDRQMVDEAYRDSLVTRQPYSIEHRLLMSDGRIKYVHEQCETDFDAEGRPLRSIGTVQDITERKLAERAAQEHAQRFLILAELSPMGAFLADSRGQWTYVNQKWSQLSNLPEESARGEGWLDAVHPEDRQRVGAAWRSCVERKEMLRIECRYRSRRMGRDGILWVLMEARPQRNESGELAGFVGSVTDVSLYKRIELALRELAMVGSGERVFPALVESLAHLFEAELVQLCRVTEEGGSEILALHDSSGKMGEGCSHIADSPCRQCLERGEQVLLLRGAHRHFRNAECLALSRLQAESFLSAPIFGSGPDPVGVLAIADRGVLDVSESLSSILELFAARAGAELERQRAEALLRNQQEVLEDLVRERTAALHAINQELESFAYSVSHDLRSPLRAIDGFSQALLEDAADCLDGKARAHLDRVRAATCRMGELIDDLLQLSRVTRGDYYPEPIDLSRLAADIVSRLNEASPGRQVEVSIAPEMNGVGDRRLLRLALENLIGNAWKYTRHRQHPRVEVGLLEGEQGERLFFVRDNGVGFDMRYVEKIFQPFQRLHSRGEFEGTGIGLATVQRVINRHGGRVWAEAEEGKGACFYFTLQST